MRVWFSTIQASATTECLGVCLELNVCFYAYHRFVLASLRLKGRCAQLRERTTQVCEAMQSCTDRPVDWWPWQALPLQ